MPRNTWLKYLFVIFLFFIIGCSLEKSEQKGGYNMKLTSPAFNEGEKIPSEYTCDGEDINPELIISDVPENTKSLALIMDDPDAPMGIWVHWVIWDIQPGTIKISKGEKITFPQGMTDFKKQEYGGPCPPSGTHRYFFKLYALDIKLNLDSGANKKDLEKAMQGHILAQAQLMGKYSR